MKTSTVALSSLALSRQLSAEAQSGQEPIAISGVQLFLDDHLIASQSNLKRVVNSPQRLAKPIVTPEPDRVFQPYVSVVQDPQSGRFRMWYNTVVDKNNSHIGYMESENGVDWIRPHRELEDPIPIGFGASVLDEGPSFTKAGERFKLVWDHEGVFTAVSPDGIKWTSTGKQPAITGTGDIVSLSFDPIRRRYLVICKVSSTPEDGYKGGTQNATEGTRRLVGQSFSEDFVNWSPVKRIIAADAKDEGITEFYSVGNVIERGGLLIGLLKVLRDDLPCEPGGQVNGIGYTVLAWTRDGERWHRERDPFLDRSSQPGAWDRAMAWGDRLLLVGDEIFVYYGGYARGHKVERFKERQIGFARMRRDRFVSRDADSAGGSLRTPAVRFNASELTVNAEIRRELHMRVLDSNGVAFPGFDFADCSPVKGDSLAHELKWKHPLQSLSGKTVQLEIQMRETRLFGIELD